jgi:FkbM family methyltransferase
VRWRLARATRAELIVRSKQGLLAVSTRDTFIGRDLFSKGSYQFDLTCKVFAFLRERRVSPFSAEGVVLDIGANNGVISIGMLLNHQMGAAIGIEPDPSNHALLKRNIAMNNLDSRYTALQVAASNRTGNVEFELSHYNFGDHRVRSPATSAVSEPNAEAARKVITVSARPIDVLIETLPAPLQSAISLVWIDVQGHEGHVFEGGKRLFSRPVPVVSEIWPHAIKRSGMAIPRFCEIAESYWSSFWVWRRCGAFVQYPISNLSKFCEELGDGTESDDIIFTQT